MSPNLKSKLFVCVPYILDNLNSIVIQKLPDYLAEAS